MNFHCDKLMIYVAKHYAVNDKIVILLDWSTEYLVYACTCTVRVLRDPVHQLGFSVW